MILSKVAAIDIGLNAVRLLISSVKKKDGGFKLKKVLHLRLPLRLGEDISRLGEISEKRTNRLIKVLKSVRYLMNIFQVDIYRAYGTSALQNSKNNVDIVYIIKEKAKIDLKVLTGTQEAQIIFESQEAYGLKIERSVQTLGLVDGIVHLILKDVHQPRPLSVL